MGRRARFLRWAPAGRGNRYLVYQEDWTSSLAGSRHLCPLCSHRARLRQVGCFFAGCCYGKACSLPWAVTFKDPRGLAPLGISLHPTQLYSSVSLFLIFAFLIFLRRTKRFHGELFWSYILVYSIVRFFMEFLRGDPRGSMLGGLFSTTQAIGIPLAGISVFMLLYLRKRGL